MSAEYRISAATVVDDFDAALVFVARNVVALRLTSPTVTIQPHAGCSGFRVCITGVVNEAIAVHDDYVADLNRMLWGSIDGTVPAPVDLDPDDYLPAWDESGGMGIVIRSEPSPEPGMVRHFVHAISPDDAEWIDLPPSIPASAICFDRGYLVVRPQRSRRGELVTLADEPSDPSPTP